MLGLQTWIVLDGSIQSGVDFIQDKNVAKVEKQCTFSEAMNLLQHEDEMNQLYCSSCLGYCLGSNLLPCSFQA